MKYHKIRNVPLAVCTAEQMQAYNFSCLYYDEIKKAYNKCTCNFQKADVIREGVKYIMNRLSENVKSKFDIDAIFCCLNAGLENYLNSKYHIIASYEEIGKIFPALYLND